MRKKESRRAWDNFYNKMRKKKNTTRRDKKLLGERDDKWASVRISYDIEKEDDGQFVEKLLENEKKEVTDRPAVNFYKVNKKIKLVRLVTKATKKSSTPKGSERF